MLNFKKAQKKIAIFFLLIFFPTLIPTQVFASSNGPKSPEAASFEPVDATDMVSLFTGQYNYTLPLLNVPSPEGGYPIALSYHAGIAVDQQASWTGLGWNVNPGAIDRSINGYPDDYNAAKMSEYFYDEGEVITRNIMSLNYSEGGASIGLNFSYGSHQSLSGQVSLGFGIPDSPFFLSYSTNGAFGEVGMGVGYGVGAMEFGAMWSTNSGFTGSASLGNNIGQSLSISTDGILKASSTGMNFSSNKGKMSLTSKFGSGIGYSHNLENSMSPSDYNSVLKSESYTLIFPTTLTGAFSLTFGKQKFKYSLSKVENNNITGPLNFSKGVVDVANQSYGCVDGICSWYGGIAQRAFMDIYEIPAENNTFESDLDVKTNNMVFPSYDNFNVQAQGMSGSMSCINFKNGSLFGLNGKETDEKFKLVYNTTMSSDATKFPNSSLFYFDNEISTYLGYTDVNEATFNTNTANTNIHQYRNDSSIDLASKPRRKTSTYVQYFTNGQINPAPNYVLPDFSTIPMGSQSASDLGYIAPESDGFNRIGMPQDGIGAFNITTPDGKTYHYSLPVYNLETVTRTLGIIEARQQEQQAYFEKRQFEPYATHWLLTAITGSDFVDNGDGKLGAGDLGYWVSFEYGQWSDAFTWKAPYKADFIQDGDNPNIKTWIRGRKQLYYLDKIKTRTHTALFVKSERTDGMSENWQYKSVEHKNDFTGQSSGNYMTRFTIPSQKQLKLDRILLLKNEDIVVFDKSTGSQSNVSINYNSQYSYQGQSDAVNKVQNAKYNSRNNIIDNGDNFSAILPKAVKVIDLNYDNSLVSGDRRLTLKSVNFKGKGGTSVLPPYKFEYNNTETGEFDAKKMADEWGYYRSQPDNWSLKKIITPQGSNISVQYETNRFKSITPVKIEFSNSNTGKLTSTMPTYVNLTTDFWNKKVVIDHGTQPIITPFYLNQQLIVKYERELCNSGNIKKLAYDGIAHVSSIISAGKYEVTFDTNVTMTDVLDDNGNTISCSVINPFNPPDYKNKIEVSANLGTTLSLSGGGPRVDKISVSDGINNLITDYNYGVNENGIGVVSYLPAPVTGTKQIPFSAELPAPRVMYEYVTVSSYTNDTPAELKTRYKFKTLTEKTSGIIEYGDLYKVEKTTATSTSANNNPVSLSSYIVKDNLNSIGQLLEVVRLNANGDMLGKRTNKYFSRDDINLGMGITKESYQSYKIVDFNNPAILDKWIVNFSTRIKYPSILESITEQSNGYSRTTKFKDYDLISGIPKTTETESSDGKRFKHVIVPAYTKYPQMGSKVDLLPINWFTNNFNKNMLSQVAAEYSYIFDNASGIWKETGVGITTWNDEWSYVGMEGDFTSPNTFKEKIWRKHKTFTWNGQKDSNGIFINYLDVNDSDGFDWALGVGNSNWKQISKVSIYDHYSGISEMTDINGNKVAQKRDDRGAKVMAVGTAGYNELFYSGAENLIHDFWLEPEVRMANARREPNYAHTGKFSVETTSSSEFGVFMRNHSAGTYKLSVWVHKDNVAKARVRFFNNDIENTYEFNGETYNAGDWVLKNHYFYNVYEGHYYVYINSIDATKVYYDDFMLRPVASSITGYVYNEWDELTHIIGSNGLAKKFEYDSAGRLVKTFTEVIDDPSNSVIGGFKHTSSNKINYKKL